MKRGNFIIVTIIVAIILIAAFAIPLNMPDGSENYTGPKREVAVKAIETLQMLSNAAPVPLFVSLHVDEVHPTTTDEARQHCVADATYSPDPNHRTHYTAIVGKLWLFGLTTEQVTLHGCRVAP